MILADVMDEIAEVLEEISGLRVFAYPPGSVNPPAGVVSYPDSIDFDMTYGRGNDKFTGLTATLVSNNATTRVARDAVSRWTAGGGVSSVKVRMEAHLWQSCDDVFVRQATFDVLTIGSVDYLCAIFEIDVTGPGSGA